MTTKRILRKSSPNKQTQQEPKEEDEVRRLRIAARKDIKNACHQVESEGSERN